MMVTLTGGVGLPSGRYSLDSGCNLRESERQREREREREGERGRGSVGVGEREEEGDSVKRTEESLHNCKNAWQSQQSSQSFFQANCVTTNVTYI